MTQLIRPGAEFRQLFRSFAYTAFRLEVRDRYNVGYETESIGRFLAGEPDDLPWLQNWLAMIREAAAEGRRFSRVRVVTVPLTDYSRFGVWCARFTNDAGEDIRYLSRTVADDAGLPNHDYWLFDSRRLARMRFDDSDFFLGAEVIEDLADVVQHAWWRDVASHYAVGLDEFAARCGV